MKKSYLLVVGIIVAIAIGYFVVQEYLNHRPLEQILTEEQLAALSMGSTFDEVQETSGEKHLIPLEAIVSGGPPKDGIPSIDDPKFDTVQQADIYLGDEGFGLDVEVGGEHRFYPFQILVFHEIVNDVFNGKPLTVTYCPLCFTGIVFDPIIDGDEYEFGVSGKLYNNNLLMYDRTTDTLWSQASGQAVVGPLTGTELEVYPSLVMSWADWKDAYPNGEVLNRNTGAIRDYTDDPYDNYYYNDAIWFPLTNRDTRLHPKAIVYGFEHNGSQKAYAEDTVKEVGRIEDEIGGQKIVVEYDADLGAVKASDPDSGNQLVLHPTFWFSWAATWPDTELFEG